MNLSNEKWNKLASQIEEMQKATEASIEPHHPLLTYFDSIVPEDNPLNIKLIVNEYEKLNELKNSVLQYKEAQQERYVNCKLKEHLAEEPKYL